MIEGIHIEGSKHDCLIKIYSQPSGSLVQHLEQASTIDYSVNGI